MGNTNLILTECGMGIDSIKFIAILSKKHNTKQFIHRKIYAQQIEQILAKIFNN